MRSDATVFGAITFILVLFSMVFVLPFLFSAFSYISLSTGFLVVSGTFITLVIMGILILYLVKILREM